MIFEHLSLPPDQVALKLAGKVKDAPAIASQIRALQSAKHKLPHWYSAACILPPISLEQASSEATSAMKSDITGGTLLDLTCGLGVDAWEFSSRFSAVTALERDPVLAEIARYNFSQLGVKNVEVVNVEAEKFIENYRGEPFDAIYCDPARRESSGQRKFLLQHCDPDVLALSGKLRVLSPAVWIKVSPLFDLTEGQRLLNPISSIYVLGVDGEVKEVLFCLSRNQINPTIGARFLRRGKNYAIEVEDDTARKLWIEKTAGMPAAFQFVLEPDPTLYKSGLSAAWMGIHQPEMKGGFAREGSWYFANEQPMNFHGTCYRVNESHPWNPGKLKKRLKDLKISRLQISRRDFDIPMDQVRKELRMEEGGKDFLLLARDSDGNRIAMLAEQIIL